MPSLLAINSCHGLNSSVYDAFLGFVSAERKRKAARFLRKEDACRCIVGEVLARYCIGQREKVPIDSIAFKTSENGKPYCDLPGKTQFSISHSKSWVVCAIDDQPIGVDVEHVHSVDFKIAERFFSPEEFTGMLNLPETFRKDRFFDLWTLKESYIKAIGKGLSCPLDSFTIIFKRERIALQTKKDLPEMFLKQYDLGPDYKCALCVSRNDFPEKIEIMAPEELLNKVGAHRDAPNR